MKIPAPVAHIKNKETFNGAGCRAAVNNEIGKI